MIMKTKLEIRTDNPVNKKILQLSMIYINLKVQFLINIIIQIYIKF